MLQSLELSGFKSFADRTRFEFPPGITVVVGPNGSGKSNIVDAIKWVLGEQSVKSLRGQEMADVIFNGSGTRRPMNSAEITLSLDNSKRHLAVDTPVVHITRRVYRGGEGEYLINRNPGRLRDIRDLLSGTGMGTQAYSVIEQGKVDVLLQSSARDRRVIFEEAAGISRFKAKKVEALRRLERVEQNLLRLSDIVEEVDGRLRGVRAQAGKARRYKQYADRLQELRTQAALVDWRRLSERLEALEAEHRALADERDAALGRAELAEARLLDIDVAVAELSEAVREAESRIAAHRERIASAESAVEHERAGGRDLEQEIARQRRQLAAMSVRAGDLTEQLQQTVEATEAAEADHQRIAMRLVEQERALAELTARLDQLHGENRQGRDRLMEAMRAAAEQGNRLSALESEMAAAEAARRRSQGRAEELVRSIEAADAERQALRQERERLDDLAERRAARLAEARQRLESARADRAARHQELADLHDRQTAARERAAVLDELERRQEGLSAGTKEVLAWLRGDDPGPLAGVCGLVADLLHVGVDVAPLIEIALGSKAQHLVVRSDGGLREHLKDLGPRLAGRVGFLWLDAPEEAEPAAELAGRAGVVGRADGFVEAAPGFAPLARRLLGRTWIVETLADALRLARTADRPAAFVTLAGEHLAADGALVVGPRHGATGLISRRSQLRALSAQIEEMDAQAARLAAVLLEMDDRIAAEGRAVETAAGEERQALEALAELRLKVTVAEERHAQLVEQHRAVEAEVRAAASQHAAASREWEAARAARQRLEADVEQMEARLGELAGQLASLDQRRAALQAEATRTQIELAKSEERLGNLHARLRQFEETRQERGRAMAEGREQLARSARRAEQSRWNILRAESEIAELYLRKEQVAAEAVRLAEARAERHAERQDLVVRAQKARAAVRKHDEAIHRVELAASEVRHERGALADRLREDYDVELAALEHEPTDEEQRRREEVQQEIDDLRRKINNLGNVNLEALEELEQLEGRFNSLSGQHQDLTAAKAALEKIIHRINTDSRRLFAETLQTVRGHFQTLFRDLFGGGHADIVLEEGIDILESGIEIVARPPGKEPRSISLLSGGEKTLTCVALLLAVFRSRPSPFCVLDEVDAALDEANIDRFIQVLQGFLDWTQFIIVTHSKKTMTCADTIYGVTMQESGVSKQVSVRFEDVSEDGHILSEGTRQAEREEPLDRRSDEETQAA
jgi:chromosome segregation protein